MSLKGKKRRKSENMTCNTDLFKNNQNKIVLYIESSLTYAIKYFRFSFEQKIYFLVFF